MKKLFRELNPYFSFYIFIKIFFPIIIGLNIFGIKKININIYSYLLLSMGIALFLFKEKSRLIIDFIRFNRTFILIFIISLLFSFSLFILFNKWNILNKNYFYLNSFFNHYMFIFIIPIFQGFYYRKILLTDLSKIYGKNCSILIMTIFFILFENKSTIKISFLLAGLPFILGYLYLEKKNVITTIIVHIFYNILIVTFINFFI